MTAYVRARTASQYVALAVENVSKAFGGGRSLPFISARPRVSVFHDVSFDLAPGDIMVLRGANGSGKTTLLRILAGLVTPDSGAVHLAQGVAHRVAFASGEERSLHWRITAQHNLEFFGSLYGMDSDAARRRAVELLDAVDLSDRAQTQVRFLSSGQRQRLLVARALMGDPEIILLDEPTGHMDEESRARIWSLLEGRCASGAAVLLATHSDEDQEHGTRIAVLADGALQSNTASETSPAPETAGPGTERAARPVPGGAGRFASWLRKLHGFFRRDFAVAWSYPAGFLLQVGGTVLGSAGLFFMSHLVGSGNPYLQQYGGSYFAFAVLGTVAFSLQFSPIHSCAYAIRDGQLTGTLEALLSTPTSLSLILAGSTLLLLLLNTIEIGLFLLVSIVFFGLQLQFDLLPLALVVLVLDVLSAVGFGFLEASILLVFKRGSPVNIFLGYATNLLGGVLYPIALIPVWLRWISVLLPVTHAANALRFALITGDASSALLETAGLALLVAVYLGAGLMGLRFALTIAQRTGSLGQY